MTDDSSEHGAAARGAMPRPPRGCILLVTVNKTEAQAVLDTFSQAAGRPWTRLPIGNKTYYDLGRHGGAPVLMVQSEMGAAAPGGALLTVSHAIQDVAPQAVIMCGVAFGLRPGKQALGDILVARQIVCYEPQKVDMKRGRLQRGDRAMASERLLDRFRSGDNDWRGARTHFGPVVSGEKLVNDPAFRDALLDVEPEAVGGEMEGAGLYAAARDAKVDWILVKGICDWADGNKHDGAQPDAAANAARFVLHVVSLGGWDAGGPWAAEEAGPPPLPPPGALPEPGPRLVGWRLRLRNEVFTGREAALLTLAEALLYEPKSATLVTQAVAGMGGIGKTQLAVEFCYRYGHFFRGVHWLNAAEPAGIEAEVAACGRDMGVEPWPDKQPEQVALTLRAWAGSGPRLVVLDNLEGVAAAEAWLARLATGGTVRVLITARRSRWPAELGLRPLRVPLFSVEESRAYLRHYLPAERAADADLDALAERLGRLPLALKLAGCYLEGPGRLRVADYVARLGEALAHPSLRGEAGAEERAGHDLGLAASFALSWDRIGDETARQVFLMAGYCAPNEPIPCQVLEQSAGLDEEGCDRAVKALLGLGLLDWEAGAAGPALHPLLAEFARGVLTPLPGAAPASPAEQARGEGSGSLSAVAKALARLAYEANMTGLPASFLPLRAHVEAAAGHCEAAGPEPAGTLWNNLGYHRKMVADYAGARAAFQRALRIDEKAYGPDHPNVARDISNLGSVLRDLGDLAGARAACERALRIWQKVLGPKHPQVAIGVNNLGNVLRDLGDLAGARAAYERALRIDEKAYGPDHPDVARDVNNLGLVLHDLGDLAGARAAFQRALRIDEKALGPDHPDVAIRVNNLGRVLRDLGDLAGARAAFERALRIDEKAYGPDHPNVARDVNSLGSVLQDLGDLAGARAAYERALAILEQFLPPDHPSIRMARGNLEGLG